MTPSAPGSVNKLSQLFWGLIFSCIGDAYLVFPDYFLFGISAFVVAQSIYVSLFGGGLVMFWSATQAEVIIGLGVAAISCLVCVLIVRHTKLLLAVVVAIYCVLISIMLWSALIQAYRSLNDHTIIRAAGATMFYTSDLLLGVDKWGMKIPYAQFFIMTTYYSAQLFITGSVLT